METTTQQNNKWAYNNHWFNYLNYAMLLVVILLVIIISINESAIQDSVKLYIIFFSVNIVSMGVSGFLILAYVHFKSPNNYIIVDDDFLIVPKSSLLPDSIYIPYSDIIFNQQITINNFVQYHLIYSGGSVILKQNQLRNKENWSSLIYRVKEMID